MTANGPSRQHEAANHGGAEFLRQSNFLSTQTRALMISTSSTGGSIGKPEAQFDKIDVLRGFSRLIAPRATFPTFRLDTSNDRSVCASGGVNVQKTTRADVGTGSGPLSSLDSMPFSSPADWPCTRATSRANSLGLVDTVTFFSQETTYGVGHRIIEFWHGLTLDGRLASGGGARTEVIMALFIDIRGTSCVTQLLC